jgi:hypothetical protein
MTRRRTRRTPRPALPTPNRHPEHGPPACRTPTCITAIAHQPSPALYSCGAAAVDRRYGAVVDRGHWRVACCSHGPLGSAYRSSLRTGRAGCLHERFPSGWLARTGHDSHRFLKPPECVQLAAGVDPTDIGRQHLSHRPVAPSRSSRRMSYRLHRSTQTWIRRPCRGTGTATRRYGCGWHLAGFCPRSSTSPSSARSSHGGGS